MRSVGSVSFSPHREKHSVPLNLRVFARYKSEKSLIQHKLSLSASLHFGIQGSIPAPQRRRYSLISPLYSRNRFNSAFGLVGYLAWLFQPHHRFAVPPADGVRPFFPLCGHFPTQWGITHFYGRNTKLIPTFCLPL